MQARGLRCLWDKEAGWGTSLVVQWLRTHLLMLGLGFDPGQGSKIPNTSEPSKPRTTAREARTKRPRRVKKKKEEEEEAGWS